jgi:hypothetical protein
MSTVRTALQDELALAVTNERLLNQARADRDASIQFLAGFPAMRQGFEIDIRKLMAERQEILRQGWDGQQPANILPAPQPGNTQQYLLQINK